MSMIAPTQNVPYYAVIFTSIRTQGDNGYEKMAGEMMDFVSKQKGFLGEESVRDDKGFGITVSYWDSLESIQAWKVFLPHKEAQDQGRLQWYCAYKVRVCRVESDQLFCENK